MSSSRKPLRIFLSHYSGDKPIVLDLYERLKRDGFRPWLANEDLLGGQDWFHEIRKEIKNADVVLVCLSRESIRKAGFVQREIRIILEFNDEQPEGAIFVIPLKLEECDLPERLKDRHWVNYFEKDGYQRLVRALEHRANATGINADEVRSLPPQGGPEPQDATTPAPKTTRAVTINPASFYRSMSPIASWLFGSVLLICLIFRAFFPPDMPVSMQTTRSLIAISVGFLFIFLIGGVVLKGKLSGFLLSVTGGFLLYATIQFAYDPFRSLASEDSLMPMPSVSPTPISGPSPTSPSPAPSPSAKASEVRPNQIAQHISRARSLYASGKYEMALRECNSALRLDPKNKEAFDLKEQIEKTMNILNP